MNVRILLFALVLPVGVFASHGSLCRGWAPVTYTAVRITGPDNSTLHEYYAVFASGRDYAAVAVLTTSTLTLAELLAFAPPEVCSP